MSSTNRNTRDSTVLSVGDEVIWKPGGILPPSVEEVSDIRTEVDPFSGQGNSVPKIEWHQLRKDGPATAVFLKGKMPTHGWLIDPVEPLPLDTNCPYKPGEDVSFRGDSPFLPHGTTGVVESISPSGVEVRFDNGYRFKVSSTVLEPAPHLEPTEERTIER